MKKCDILSASWQLRHPPSLCPARGARACAADEMCRPPLSCAARRGGRGGGAWLLGCDSGICDGGRAAASFRDGAPHSTEISPRSAYFCLFARMLSSSRAFVVVCDGCFSPDFDGPSRDCSTIHSMARNGSSGFYTLDTLCDIPPVMQLLGCSAIGGAVSGFPEGGGDSFTAR